MNRKQRRAAKAKDTADRRKELPPKTRQALEQALVEAGGNIERALAIFNFKADPEAIRGLAAALWEEEAFRRSVEEYCQKIAEERPDIKTAEELADEAHRRLKERVMMNRSRGH